MTLGLVAWLEMHVGGVGDICKSQELQSRDQDLHWGFPGGSVVKNPPASADVGDADSTRGSGRASGEGNGHPLQYSCLENPMDRGAWRATVSGAAKSGR